MAKDKISPAVKSVPSQGGIKNGGNSTISTPKDNEGKVWSSKEKQTEKIF